MGEQEQGEQEQGEQEQSEQEQGEQEQGEQEQGEQEQDEQEEDQEQPGDDEHDKETNGLVYTADDGDELLTENLGDGHIQNNTIRATDR